MHDDPLDCLIVGAGPAGLTAATYLIRFHRRIAVVDADESRARWIPASHNCPGFPAGIAGSSLLERLREQACSYGATITPGRITALERDAEAFLATAQDGEQWRARHVLLATGIVDRMPQMEGLEHAIDTGTVRLCAVCDGYEASDERIAVFAPADEAIRHGVFLRTFSRSVTAVRSEPGEPDATHAQLAEAAGIRLLPVPTHLRSSDDHCEAVFDDGSHQAFDTLYPVLGGDAQAHLAVQLGARVDEHGELEVDAQMQSSIDGLYAIGDVVSALNQISVAVGHAAIASSAIHGRLPSNYREDASSQPGTARAVRTPPGEPER
ncbi:MAG: NAD(P)/FAD-dependent oxidoreductase [Pseudomonadota bacterium]|nr:NAD(P)/FAD-dependent oxidoreductase [Pseudomonadota bacterium]